MGDAAGVCGSMLCWVWCSGEDYTVRKADRDEVGVGRHERGAVRDALHEDDPHALPLDLTPHLHRGGGTREAGRRGRGTCDTDLLGVVCASSRAWEGRVRSSRNVLVKGLGCGAPS